MMATENPIPDISTPAKSAVTSLLVLLPAMQPESLDRILSNLAHVNATLPGGGLLVATPDTPTESHPSLAITQAPQTIPSWTLTAADFVNAYQLAEKNSARAILILGSESASLSPLALRELSGTVLSNVTDLAAPCYDLPPRAGLVNSAILYPLTRALFATRIRFPLTVDLGLSMRMAERLANAAQRFTISNQADAILWPVEEAMIAGFAIKEIDVGHRDLPQPAEGDFNAIMAKVVGSIFADIDAKAAFWQRARALPLPRHPMARPYPSDGNADIASMLDSFRFAYTNLREIWSLVLPPNSLLGLKRLTTTEAVEFRMPDNLWARIVYDFLVAYRLRTLNRGHLLGALIPLYLAWVASHINIAASGTDAERHIEAVAAAFEADKPYLVSRWRWPDRFNP
jgi:phosphotransferase system HPr-like phosphotransfer protein